MSSLHETRAQPSIVGVGQVQRILALRTFSGFFRAPTEAVAALAEHTEERFFERGSHLLTQGLPVRSTHFLLRGAVEVRSEGKVLRTLGPRAAVGGLAVLARDPRGYDLVAIDDTVTLELLAEDMWDIFEDHFALVRGVMMAVARDLVDLRKRAGPSAGFSLEIKAPFSCPGCALNWVERLAFLRNTFHLETADMEAMGVLARETKEVRLAAGETLWTEGEPGRYSLMIIAGVVRCVSQETSQTFTFGPGDGVGFLDAVASVPRWYTATSSEPVLALRLDIDLFHDVLEDHGELARALLQSLATAHLQLLGTTPESPSTRPPT